MRSSPDEIVEYFAELSFESRAIEKEVTDICWYMRGSVSWDQAWRLTNRQRDVIAKIIKNNIERTEKLGMPLL